MVESQLLVKLLIGQERGVRGKVDLWGCVMDFGVCKFLWEVEGLEGREYVF